MIPIVLLLFAPIVSAQDLTQFEKILVPVLNAHVINGVNGSEFGTSLGVYSPQRPFNYYPAFSPTTPTVPAILATLPSRQAIPFWEAPGVTAQGRFLFVQPDSVDLPFSAMAVSRDAAGFGTVTQLPIVRARDTRTATITLMDIPVTPILSAEDPSSPEHFHLVGWKERNTLRIYDWDGDGSLVVKVRLIVSPGQQSHGAIDVPVNRRDFDDPTYPYYAIVDLQSAFGPSYCYYAEPHVACSGYDANLLITGNGTAPFYAIASSTDNTSNRFTVFTPR